MTDDKQSSQQQEMQQVFDRFLMGNILLEIFSWMGFFIFKSGQPGNSWPTGILWLLAGVVIFATSTMLKSRLQRAYRFHYLVFFQSLLNMALIFDSSSRLIHASINLNNGFLPMFLAVSILVALLGLFFQQRLIRVQLRSSFNHNVKSGRLDVHTGFWNLSAPLHLDAPKKETAIMRRINSLFKLSPLVTALAFALARSIEGSLQMLVAALSLYFFGYIIIWGYAKHLAIAIQLQEWEHTHNVIIRV